MTATHQPCGQPNAQAATDPVTVTICGSMRFRDLMLHVAEQETASGRMVLMPFAVVNQSDQGGEFKAMLDELHRAKIRAANVVLVVSDGTGYYGESTSREIEYARDLGLPVEFRLVSSPVPIGIAPRLGQPINYIHDLTQRLNEACPGLEPDLLRLYVLLALAKGPHTTLEDVHDAWSIWRDQTRPDHPSLVPFNELAVEVQELDRPYRDAIATVAPPVSATATRDQLADDLVEWWHTYGTAAPWEATGEPISGDLLEAAQAYVTHATGLLRADPADDEADRLYRVLAAIHRQLDRLDETGKELDTDTIRATLFANGIERPRLPAAEHEDDHLAEQAAHADNWEPQE
jgi:hypothetical protein